MWARTFSTKELLNATVHLLQKLPVPFQALDYLSEVFFSLSPLFIERKAGFLKGVDRIPQRLELDVDQVLSGYDFNTAETAVSTGKSITKMMEIYFLRYDSSSKA